MQNKPYKITLLGTGLIGTFYTMSLHGQRKMDRVHRVYSRSEDRARNFAGQWGIPHWGTDMEQAIESPETDVIVIGLPNHLHLEAVRLAARAGKAILCTKPLGRNAQEALEMLRIVEEAGIFNGYLEDLVYPSKTLKALASIKNGALGKVLWTRSREAHPGPHSDWFWDAEISGGGAIIDMGCHCIEIGRNYIGKDIRPIEVMCWADTLVKPIEAEDNAIMDACYKSAKSKKWEPVALEVWRGKEAAGQQPIYQEYDQDHYLIKKELLPDGRRKLILKEKSSGDVIQRVTD